MERFTLYGLDLTVEYQHEKQRLLRCTIYLFA
jgi:hypothetical protein